jgi:hypothetical protein
MNKIKLYIIAVFIANVSFSQSALIESDKIEYKFDDKIEITFKINFAEDSISFPEFKYLKIIEGPFKFSSTSLTVDKIERVNTWRYVFRPEKIGDLIIESPVFFYSGKKILANNIILKVSEKKFSDKEMSSFKFKTFVEDKIKPNQTFRYVINENLGYIEVSEGSKWKFYRKMSMEEINVINKIK